MLRVTSSALMMRASGVLREQENWRDSKITYLQYLNVCTETLHSVLKPKAAQKYAKFSVVGHGAQEIDELGLVNPKEGIPAHTADYGKNAGTTAAH